MRLLPFAISTMTPPNSAKYSSMEVAEATRTTLSHKKNARESAKVSEEESFSVCIFSLEPVRKIRS